MNEIDDILTKIYTSDLLTSEELHILTEWIREPKERIDKAIDYLTDPTKEFSEDCYYKICETAEAEDLLNILKGSEE